MSTDPYEGREKRRLWAVSDYGTMGLHDCYSCGRPNEYWCPKMGFSSTIGFGFFLTKEEAKAHLIDRLESKIRSLQTALANAKAL